MTILLAYMDRGWRLASTVDRCLIASWLICPINQWQWCEPESGGTIYPVSSPTMIGLMRPVDRFGDYDARGWGSENGGAGYGT